MSNAQKINQAVAKLYDTYPFPPDPLLDEPPPGYNWRWNWTAAYNFCTGRKPERQDVRILDAGCGTGVGTEYLVHLNPQATVTGIDISEGALEVARERCRRSGADRATFYQMTLEEAETQLEGEFQLINCVGVLHHLPDPVKGILPLAKKLASGGLLHIFVYAELGRWEVQLMQEAIALLQQDRRGDYTDGVKVGRELFSTLPEQNPLVQREKERWSLENQRDECFADMYVHPQEVDYNIKTLFELIDASGLEFVGFSNPQFWQLERLVGQSRELIERGKGLSDRDYYRLVELLDPKSVTHYEFFLAKPPLSSSDWTSDRAFLQGIPELHPCIDGWESRCLFNYNYEIVNLSETEFTFMQKCAANPEKTVEMLLEESGLELEQARNLHQQQLIVLR
ncbi:class I SAM-dependent methyltransferase [Spirulina sp. CS-785/01]|uniref:class I SAM-dependent methyltransferase n=1 Tax=Spirulina sp. CS-785/01 TaxID=3021716 RepID=UPI00232B630D|nr:class I SAM-dependent methyltransferase [Spirulina sp. CS-785/01]MDB9315407.1 class I SAM-dependent methyltransferase [Spirulina sp. CS-785/01]